MITQVTNKPGGTYAPMYSFDVSVWLPSWQMRGSIYLNQLDAIRTMYRTEGWRSFYRGWAANSIKVRTPLVIYMTVSGVLDVDEGVLAFLDACFSAQVALRTWTRKNKNKWTRLKPRGAHLWPVPVHTECRARLTHTSPAGWPHFSLGDARDTDRQVSHILFRTHQRPAMVLLW